MHQKLLSLLRCPQTGETLTEVDGHSLVNQSGTHRYPVIHGIPDFRHFDPPYMTRQEESDAADRIAEASRDMDYDALIEFFERKIFPHPRPEAKIEASIEHRRSLAIRSPSRLESLLDITARQALPKGVTLDLGCGSGEACAALKQRGAAMTIGLDISLVELMLAKKLLAENGEEAFLVAGCAEALPFASESLDFIYSPDVIEHVSDQSAYLSEAQRALKPGGNLLLNSPNRFSIVSPEPHIGVWFFGFLPRAAMDPVCKLLGKGGYIGKRLISLNELRAILDRTFPKHRIEYRRSNPQSHSLPGKVFFATRAVAEPAFSYVCDQHIVLTSK